MYHVHLCWSIMRMNSPLFWKEVSKGLVRKKHRYFVWWPQHIQTMCKFHQKTWRLQEFGCSSHKLYQNLICFINMKMENTCFAVKHCIVSNAKLRPHAVRRHIIKPCVVRRPYGGSPKNDIFLFYCCRLMKDESKPYFLFISGVLMKHLGTERHIVCHLLGSWYLVRHHCWALYN